MKVKVNVCRMRRSKSLAQESWALAVRRLARPLLPLFFKHPTRRGIYAERPVPRSGGHS